MHEYSIASSIAQTVLESAAEHKAAKIHTINLEIGELVFLNIEQVTFWLDELFKDTPAREAEINVTNIKGEVKCLDCNYLGPIEFLDSPLYHYKMPNFLCPDCKSYNIEITRGRECMVRNIKAET